MKLSPAPRFIPLPVRINALFGGFGNQFGWFFFGFGMVFFNAFCTPGIISEIQLIGPKESTVAKITDVRETNMEVNETEVVAHHYEFKIKGEDYEGVSYITGRELTEGKHVNIVYKVSNPRFSYIDAPGFRASQAPWWVGLFVLIFPAVGLGFIVPSVLKGRKDIQLLTHGKLTLAELVNKEATNTSVNDETVYKMTFAYTVKKKTYHTMVRTHDTWKLEDEDEERLLYLPQNPEKAILLDNVSGGLEVSPYGNFQAKKPIKSLMSLISPVAFILINGVVLALML